MEPLLNGIFFGLILTILTGPIFFALVQIGIERGFRAGFVMGLGIWISDVIIVLGVYQGVAYFIKATEMSGFKLWMGIAGGVILIVIGTLTLLSPPPDMAAPKNIKTSTASYLTFFAKGFLINTINPFTFFFWVSVMTTVVIKEGFGTQASFLFFGGIIGTIMVTDSLKVGMAKYIRRWLRPIHVLWTRRISGVALVLFGIALMIRVMV